MERADSQLPLVALYSNNFATSRTKSGVLKFIERSEVVLGVGLERLYDEAVAKIKQLGTQIARSFMSILAAVALAYRPLHLLELPVLVSLKMTLWRDDLAGSIQEHVRFPAHNQRKSHIPIPSVAEGSCVVQHILSGAPGPVHFDMFRRSLEALSSTLHMNLYRRDRVQCLTHGRYSS